MAVNVLQNVSFDYIKSFDDLGLILKNKSISSPKTRGKSVDIPMRNGSLDFTETLGGVRYGDRTITMNFLLMNVEFESLEGKKDNLLSLLHGKRMRIIFDDDLAFYWLGRVEVSGWKIGKGVNPSVTITIKATVDPYKYSIMTNEDDWLWNPFDFENDTINQTANILVPSGYVNQISVFTLDDDRVTAPIVISDRDDLLLSIVKVGGHDESNARLGTAVLGRMILGSETREGAEVIIKDLLVKKGSQVVYDLPLEKSTGYYFYFTNNGEMDATISINYVGGML